MATWVTGAAILSSGIMTTSPAIQTPSTTENYSYECADGERVARAVSGGTTTYFAGSGMWEEDSTGTTRSLYQLGGAVIAQRSVVPAGVQQPYYVQPAHLLAAAATSAGPTQAKATPTPLLTSKEQAYLPCGNAVAPEQGYSTGCPTPRPTATPTPVPQPTVRLIYLHGDHFGSASVATRHQRGSSQSARLRPLGQSAFRYLWHNLSN